MEDGVEIKDQFEAFEAEFQAYPVQEAVSELCCRLAAVIYYQRNGDYKDEHNGGKVEANDG